MNVVFSFDANPDVTRTGTLTIGGQTLNVTQAGSTYVPAAPVTTLVSSGLSYPFGVAMDGAGNLYIADTDNNAIKKWTAANNSVTTLVSSGLDSPQSVAVGGSGNVYIADTQNSAIRECTATNGQVITLVSSGLYYPHGVAVDGSGNVFIADTDNNAIKEWMPVNSNVTTLAASGLSSPYDVAVDAADNVYIADTENYAIKQWAAANGNVNTLVSLGLVFPAGVAVDGGGNVYIADTDDGAIKEWTAVSSNVTTLVSSGLYDPRGVAVDGARNVYIADSYDDAIKELPYAFVDPTPKTESYLGGNDALPAVLPVTANLLAPFAPTSDQSWLTITGTANGVVSFSLAAAPGNTRTAHISLLGQTIPVTQVGAATYSLGTIALLEGPSSGSNSVVLAVFPNSGPWTASADAGWLHLTAANQSGTGSANIVFSYDANSGATRVGTLTICGLTLTVTQAGSTYVAAGQQTALLTAGLNAPGDLALDGQGDIYIAAPFNNAIQEWNPANNGLATLISSTNFNTPYGVALDGAGNVYVADTYNNAIKEWTVADSNLTALVSSGLDHPLGLALDSAGNIYIADVQDNAVKEWVAATSSLITLVSSGLNQPYGVAVDAAENVYIADTYNGAIKEWTFANGNVTTVVSGLDYPYGLGVDGSGNIYIADTGNQAIKKWTAANSNLTVLSSGAIHGFGIEVDALGNIYYDDYYNPALYELPYAFVDASAKTEPSAAGSDVLPPVLPSAENLLPPFAPTSDQPWLTVTSVSNGVLSFAFSADAGPPRTAHITLLSQVITIAQNGSSYSLGTTLRLEGPMAGSDSVVLSVNPSIASWAATANSAWLHIGTTNQNGTGSTNVVFSYDANPGETRSGTLTIAGLTLTVTQAGSTYVAAGAVTALVSNGLSYSSGVTVDRAGNVYLSDYGNSAVKKWTVANNMVTTLVSSGLNGPEGLAVDGAGNVYIADNGDNAIKEWTVANNTVTTLVSSGLNGPQDVALDGAGNVYITDSGNSALKEWTAVNSNVITLVSSGLYQPNGVAVDAAGNVYIGDNWDGTIEKWTTDDKTLTTLVSGIGVDGVAVDGAGNVYIANYDNSTIQKWLAANSTLITLVSSGLNQPEAVAVDGTGNVYITDTYDNAIKELPYAYVDPTPKLESLAPGADSLPAVLPATANLRAPFAPTSDQPWLTITGITNGVVSFSFTANSGPARTANITLLGLTIPVTQGTIGTPPNLTGAQLLVNGVLQFSFTNTPSGSFTVISTTNLSLPLSDWTVVGAASNTAPGQFQFTTQMTTNAPELFYGVRSP
jgi:DNA-binding beta-propeller fold protein YncE